MKRNNGVDLFRLIGAFFVMILHFDYVNVDSDYVYNIRLLARWAVPFYFITTGYFWGNKIQNGGISLVQIQRNISTLITILIVCNVIYIPVCIVIGKFSFNLENLLIGSFFHLWFIGSMIFGYLTIWYLYFNKKEYLLPYISVLMTIMALFASSYDQLLGKNLGYYTTRFLLSIPFMYLGICISKINFAQVNKALLLALIVLGIGLQIAEAQFFASVFNFDKSMHEFLIGTIFIVIPLFILCLTINIPENKLTNWGKEYSLFIYLYHPVIYLILHAFFVKIFPRYSDNILVYNPFIGFIVILLLAITLKKHLNKTYKLLIGLIN